MFKTKVVGISTDSRYASSFGVLYDADEFPADIGYWQVRTLHGFAKLPKFACREIPNFKDTTRGGYKYRITDYIHMFGFVYLNTEFSVSVQWDPSGKCLDRIGMVPDDLEEYFQENSLDLMTDDPRLPISKVPVAHESIRFDGPSIIEAEFLAIKKRLDDLESVNKPVSGSLTHVIAVAKEPTASGKYPTSAGIAISREEELYSAYPKHSFNYIKFNL